MPFNFRWLVAQLLACALLCLAQAAAAADLVQQRLCYEDPQGELSFSEVRTKAPLFKACGNYGFTPSTLWFRLRINVPPDLQRVAVTVLLRTLDTVAIYDDNFYPLGMPLSERVSFVDVQPGHQVIYLKVASRGSSALTVSVLTPAQLTDAEGSRLLAFGVLAGVAIPTLLLMMFMWALFKQAIAPVGFLQVLVSLLIMLNGLGFIDEALIGLLVWPTPLAGHLLLLLSALFSVAFLRLLLIQLGLPTGLARLYLAVMGLQLFMLVLMPFADRQNLVLAATVLASGVIGVTLPLAFFLFFRRNGVEKIVSALLILGLAGTLRQLLQGLGFIAVSDWVSNALWLRSAVVTAILITLLGLIFRTMRNSQQLAETHAEASILLAKIEAEGKQAKDRLLVMLLHELKNPLAVIQLAISSLNRVLQGPEESKRLLNMQRAWEDMNQVIERCVEADRIDLMAVPTTAERFLLHDLVDDIGVSLDLTRVQSRVPQTCELQVNYAYLRIILKNLMSNALKYSLPGTPIVLRLAQDPGRPKQICLALENQAAPGSEPDPEQLFSRYYRGPYALNQAGAGLGLWLSQALAERLGGGISYRRLGDVLIFQINLKPA
jgi:signal transduction histidine kinase